MNTNAYNNNKAISIHLNNLHTPLHGSHVLHIWHEHDDTHDENSEYLQFINILFIKTGVKGPFIIFFVGH